MKLHRSKIPSHPNPSGICTVLKLSKHLSQGVPGEAFLRTAVIPAAALGLRTSPWQVAVQIAAVSFTEAEVPPDISIIPVPQGNTTTEGWIKE